MISWEGTAPTSQQKLRTLFQQRYCLSTEINSVNAQNCEQDSAAFKI
jgi:hypothetical protein